MKTVKLIIFNILVYLSALNTVYLYFSSGLTAFSISKEYLITLIMPFLTITVLFTMSLLVSISYVASSGITKKNLLRIPLLMLIILTILSFIGRIRELLAGTFCISCWINTVLYIIMLILLITILKDFYKLVEKLFNKKL